MIDLIFGGVKLGAVEAGFRGQIPPLIGQFRHDLAGGRLANSVELQRLRMVARSSSLSLFAGSGRGTRGR